MERRREKQSIYTRRLRGGGEGEESGGASSGVRGCVVFSQSEKDTSPTVGGGVGRGACLNTET